MDKYITQSLNKVKPATRCKPNRSILRLHQRLLSELAFAPTPQSMTATRQDIQNVAQRMEEQIALIILPCATTMPKTKAVLTTALMLRTINAITLLMDSLAAALKLAGH